MDNNFQYRLSQDQKNKIAQNLIDILQQDEKITKDTRTFICNWILTDGKEKGKALFDVWDIVLKNFLPTSRPVLFRACQRISKVDKIASFTGRLECARRFSKEKGILMVCDTKDRLKFKEEFYSVGFYKHTFYPLVDVLVKAQNSGGWGFPERILNDYMGEDEYIMNMNSVNIHSFRWLKSDL